MEQRESHLLTQWVRELREAAESVVGRADFILKNLELAEEQFKAQKAQLGTKTAAERTEPLFPPAASSGKSAEVVSLADRRAAKEEKAVLDRTAALEEEPAVRAVSPAKPNPLRVLQDRLVRIIDENEEALRNSIAELGCGGDCYKCPKPNKATVDEQVFACLDSVVQGLELDLDLLKVD
jgi:hypothetical protein